MSKGTETKAIALAIALAVLSGYITVSQSNSPAAASVQSVSVRLSNFAFNPNHLVLKASVPIRLRLINDSSGGHNFSAPAFFAASSVQPGSIIPVNGAVAVSSEQTVELTVVPHTPGQYKVDRTHFLHHFFGMTGTIDVAP